MDKSLENSQKPSPNGEGKFFNQKRNYQRKHLRAPYKESVLYVDEGFVFKAKALNLSEGGLLLDQVPHFPAEGKSASLLLSLPQFPFFKNFSLDRLLSFSPDIYAKKTARVVCEVVRRSGVHSDVDQVFISRVGARFIEIEPRDKKVIKEYVEVFASNLIFLQFLIDNIQADERGLEKVRALAGILGYEQDVKISRLRKEVSRDYLSLQWL